MWSEFELHKRKARGRKKSRARNRKLTFCATRDNCSHSMEAHKNIVGKRDGVDKPTERELNQRSSGENREGSCETEITDNFKVLKQK